MSDREIVKLNGFYGILFILTCPREMIRVYKILIDSGFQMTFADGIEHELKTVREQLKSVIPETIADRREGLLKRGRNQKMKEIFAHDIIQIFS